MHKRFAFILALILAVVLISGCDSHKHGNCNDSVYFIQKDLVITEPEQCADRCLVKYKSENFLIEEDKDRPGNYLCYCDLFNCTGDNQTQKEDLNIINERKNSCKMYAIYDPNCNSQGYAEIKQNVSSVCKRYGALVNKSYPCDYSNLDCIKQCCEDYCLWEKTTERCSGFVYFSYQDHKLNSTNFMLELLNSRFYTNVTAIAVEGQEKALTNMSIKPGGAILISVDYQPSLASGQSYNYTVSVFYSEGNQTKNETAICNGKIE